MKKIIKKTEEVKTGKNVSIDTTRKITEDDLDSVEISAMHHLAERLAMRRVLKDLFEGKDEEKEAPRRTMHSALDEMGNPWDDLFGNSGKDDEQKKPRHDSKDWRIHLDPDEEPWEDDDEDDDDDEPESATNKFLSDNYKPNILGLYMPRPRAKCADGYSVSIQAGSGANVHCWPHEDTNEFTHVMLDNPSCEDEELVPYRCDLDDEDEIFYLFVPVEVMDKVLEKHGGIVGKEDDADALLRMLGVKK